MRQNANLEASGPDGLSPLQLACRCDAVGVIRLLLDQRANPTGAADICEAHGTARALQVLQGVDLKNEDPVCESEGELAPIGTEERRIGTFTKEEGDKSESSQRPCFGSAVDPTFLEDSLRLQ